ncbi:MAG: hypothetical protein ACMUIE_01055 [Thermoplasmatota archaeon]
MAEYSEEMENLVPFEIGLQAGETVLMWVGATVLWLLSILLMGLTVGFSGLFKEGPFGILPLGFILYLLGGFLLVASQFVSRWNPIRTTRIPITGIALWLFVIFLAGFILWEGWSVYLGASSLWFTVAYVLIALLITAGLLGANFLTSLKILNWMSVDMVAFFYTWGALSLLIGVTHIGFNNRALLSLEDLNFWDWVFLFAFSLAFIFMLELFNGAHRFNDIIKYAKERSTGEFSLTPVINNYYIMGSILMTIIGLLVLFILILYFFTKWWLDLLVSQLADSIMANSLYLLVYIVAIVFIPTWIALILWMEYRNRKESAEEEEMRRKREKQSKLGIY